MPAEINPKSFKTSGIYNHHIQAIIDSNYIAITAPFTCSLHPTGTLRFENITMLFVNM
jgi:hypothetical protein